MHRQGNLFNDGRGSEEREGSSLFFSLISLGRNFVARREGEEGWRWREQEEKSTTNNPSKQFVVCTGEPRKLSLSCGLINPWTREREKEDEETCCSREETPGRPLQGAACGPLSPSSLSFMLFEPFASHLYYRIHQGLNVASFSNA